LNTLLNNPQFLKELIALSEKLNQPYEEVHKTATACLNELQTQHSPLTNMLGLEFAQFILYRGYNKNIDVKSNEIKAIAKMARQHPIAFVMTHKTYLDMFVLGIVLMQHGVPLPHIFAGINLDLPVVSQLARQNGVIFIRRSFKDDLIYKVCLRHFIGSLLNDGAHFMWAIEGTRSRTGKLVWPKMGILKYIYEAEQNSKKAVKYVPVSIVYDLIPDVQDMTAEGRGSNKNPESLGMFMNYVRRMNHNLGKISLRFGEPVKIDAPKTVAIIKEGHNLGFFENEISQFAIELAHQVNNITPVTTASLICIALLAKFSLTKRSIENNVVNLMLLIEQHEPDALVDRGKPIGECVQSALNLLLRDGLVLQRGQATQAKFVLNSENYLQVTYYANMSIQHLFKRAFIELALLHKDADDTESQSSFWQQILALRKLFKFEFFFSKKLDFINELEDNLKAISPNWSHLIKSNLTEKKQFLSHQKTLIAPVVLQNYVEAYRVVAFALKDRDATIAFNEKEFINDCVFISEELHWQGLIQRVEAVRQPFLVNGVRLVQNLDLIPTATDNKKEVLNDFLEQLNQLSDKIKWLQSQSIEQKEDTISLIPIEREIVPGSKTEAIAQSILESEKGAHIGAFFDLDKTLISGFSAKSFVQSRMFSGKATRKEIVSQFSGVMVYAMGQRNFAGMAAVSAQGVKGILEKVFIDVGEDVYHKHLSKQIYPEARALVNAHLAQGHTVAIVSAATPYQVNPIAQDLNVEHIMCTQMEVKNGRFTGNIVEPACWGEGKAWAGQQLAEKHQLDLSKSYFYTDSHEDAPLLEIVGHPQPVNPDVKLSAMAFKNGWPVYRFDGAERPSTNGMMRTALAASSLFPAALSGLANGIVKYSKVDGTNALMASVGDLVTAAAGIELVVKGKENLWSHRPAVFIFNHQSNTDLFIVSKLIRKNATGIAKKELKIMPVIGQLMQAAGVIFIDRKDKEKAIEAMQPAVDALKNGTSLIIFPEGTRSKDYTLGPFKKGAFHLAMQAGVPVVPVIIRNAHDAMPRGSNIFRPAAIEVIALKPISTKRWKKERLGFQIKKIRKMYLKELGQEE